MMHRSNFVKCRCKGDLNKTSFRSPLYEYLWTGCEGCSLSVIESALKTFAGAEKNAPKRRRTCQKWSKNNQVDMFNNVRKHPKPCYRATRHIQFMQKSNFVKCRFKGDTSKIKFPSPCEMAFFGTIRVRLTWFLTDRQLQLVFGKIGFWGLNTFF